MTEIYTTLGANGSARRRDARGINQLGTNREILALTATDQVGIMFFSDDIPNLK